MTAADEAYNAAVEETLRVKAASEEVPRLDDERYTALDRIPAEIPSLTDLRGAAQQLILVILQDARTVGSCVARQCQPDREDGCRVLR